MRGKKKGEKTDGDRFSVFEEVSNDEKRGGGEITERSRL